MAALFLVGPMASAQQGMPMPPTGMPGMDPTMAGMPGAEQAVPQEPPHLDFEGSEAQQKMIEAFGDQLAAKKTEFTNKYTLDWAIKNIEMFIQRRFKEKPTTLGWRRINGKPVFTALEGNALGDFSILRSTGITLRWADAKKYTDRKNPKSRKTKAQIVTEVYEEAEIHAEEVIQPEEQKKAIREQAEERFKMVHKNERVSLTLRGGRGANAIITNQPFRTVNDEYVQLGNRTIIKEDLEPEDQAKFYPDINEKMKEDYIKNLCGKVDVEYESAVDAYVLDNTAKRFRENGYVPDIKKETASLRTSKPDYWIVMEELLNRITAAFIDRETCKYEASDEFVQWKKDQGYFLVDTLDHKGKEWIDKEEYDYRTKPKTPVSTPTDPSMMGMPAGMGGMPAGMGGMPAGMPR